MLNTGIKIGSSNVYFTLESIESMIKEEKEYKQLRDVYYPGYTNEHLQAILNYFGWSDTSDPTNANEKKDPKVLYPNLVPGYYPDNFGVILLEAQRAVMEAILNGKDPYKCYIAVELKGEKPKHFGTAWKPAHIEEILTTTGIPFTENDNFYYE